MAPITASAPCTMAMMNATAMRPVRERASTTTTLASANERLLLAAYIALTCASPDEDSAATEKPALVSALAIVTNAQIQKSRRFAGLLIVFMLARRYRVLSGYEAGRAQLPRRSCHSETT